MGAAVLASAEIPQSATVSAAFASPLTVTVDDSGDNAVSSLTVFTVRPAERPAPLRAARTRQPSARQE